MRAEQPVKIETGTKVLIKSNPKSVWIVAGSIDDQWFLLQNTNQKSHPFTTARIDNLEVVIV